MKVLLCEDNSADIKKPENRLRPPQKRAGKRWLLKSVKQQKLAELI